MKILKFIYIILASCLLSSCFYPFDLDIDDEAVIVLESYPGIDDVVGFRLEAAYSNSNAAPKPDFDPHIVFKVNGKEVPAVLNTGFMMSDNYPEYYYVADYKAFPGDELTVEVSSEGFKTIHAETKIPSEFPKRRIDYREEKVGLRDLDIVYVTLDVDKGNDYAYGLQILSESVHEQPENPFVLISKSSGRPVSDFYEMAPGSLECMGLYLYSIDAVGRVWSWKPEGDEELTMSLVVDSYGDEEADPYDSFFVHEIELPLYDEDGNVKEMYRVIKRNKLLLYTMSDELYKYSLAKELIEDNADMFAGLAPSNFCYSNIVGGYGIFGGVSIVETDWITPEFIEKNR